MGSTYHSVHVHVIFACKDRKPMIAPEIQKRIHEYIFGICRKRGCMLVEGGGVEDHVHLLLGMSMTKTIADLLRDIKTNTSRWIHETWPERDFAWQDGYGAFSVSVLMVEKTREYIRNQAEHHKTQSFDDELKAFLKMHGMRMEPDGSVTKIEPEDSAAPDGAPRNEGDSDTGG